jgi:hypothetical protein
MKLKTTLQGIAISKEARRILNELLPILEGRSINQVFTGSINLCNELTPYNNWTANSNAEVTLVSDPIIGGSAEIRMIGDGTHTPLFSAFVKSAGSSDFSPTLAAINKVVFYYDGTSAFYSITVL